MKFWVIYPFKEFCLYDVGANLEEARSLSKTFKSKIVSKRFLDIHRSVDSDHLSKLPTQLHGFPVSHYDSREQLFFHHALNILRTSGYVSEYGYISSKVVKGFKSFLVKDLESSYRRIAEAKGSLEVYASSAQVHYLENLGITEVDGISVSRLTKGQASLAISLNRAAPKESTEATKKRLAKELELASLRSLYMDKWKNEPPYGWSLITTKDEQVVAVPPWLKNDLIGKTLAEVNSNLRKRIKTEDAIEKLKIVFEHQGVMVRL